MSQVIRTEEWKYITVPDGDDATIEEIFEYLQERK